MDVPLDVDGLPDEEPNAAATRSIFPAGSPGAIRLTSMAALIKATKALTRKKMIMPTTVAMPNSKMATGCNIFVIQKEGG